MNSNILQPGKLNIQILRKLLQQYSKTDERVLLGPQIGEDAAAIDMGEKVLVVANDPITFATDEIGYYSVMVNANDVVTTGAEPKWFTVTVLLPEGQASEGLVDSIFEQIHRACEKLNISLIGGHTEITSGLDRPILVGQLIGEVSKEDMLATAGAKPDDVILLSKGICIEGTAIIARERGGDLLSRGVSKELIMKAQRFLFEPGISVADEARFALRSGHVTSMHDITEGGLADGLHELSIAAGVQIEIEKDRIPIYEESRILCKTFGLNPLGVIGSGALLITASQPETEKILTSAHREGVPITKIGRIKGFGSPSVIMVSPEGFERVPYFERDEVVKIF